MRIDAKAATAGSNRRSAKKLGLPLLALAAAVAALTVVVGSASGSTTRFLVETFGSAEQPSFPADRGMGVDQGSGALHVIDSTEDTLTRFDADGTPSNFSALGSNVIDGEGAGDETAHGHLAFSFDRQREQVAIDESGEATDGNIYLTQSALDVVDIFDSAGEYLGQLSESTAGGIFGEPCGVAVDAEGTVYVGDRGDDLIHVFEPEALATAPVNADNTASFATLTDPCTLAAGAGATAGFLFVDTSFGAVLSKLDAASGEVKYQLATGASTVSVDPTTGHVFAARNTFSSSTVDEYDASGASEATLVSSFKPGSTAEGVAVNSASEEVYVARSGTENVEVFGPAAVVPDVVTEAPSSNTGTRATLAGTVNPDGVELDECFFEWGEDVSGGPVYGNVVPCAQTPAEIGASTAPVAVSAEITGLDPHGDDFGTEGGDYEYRLVAVNPNATVNGSNRTFVTPDTVFAEAASGITPTEATLNGTVNPDTATISECVFEWGPEKEPGEEIQQFPETVPCVPGPGGITGESPVPVEADIAGLEPGSTYFYQLKVAYPGKTVIVPNPNNSSNSSETISLQTLGPVIAGTWSEDVVRSEATLKASVNPAGRATTYRFEWGTDETYGSETAELPVGSDSSDHELTRLLSGLTPGTAYHFRVVATNSDAENVGPDTIFTTYERPAPDLDCPNQDSRYGPSAKLPDCRAYEMVTPVDKTEGIRVFAAPGGSDGAAAVRQSAPGGEKLTYSSLGAFGDTPSRMFINQYISTRTPSGWSTHGVNAPQGTTIFDPEFVLDELSIYFQAFTPDLSSAWVKDFSQVPLAPGGREGFPNFYRRDTDDSYEAISTVTPSVGSGDYTPEVRGLTDDGSRVFITDRRPLTPDAAPNTKNQVYEHSSGELKLISVLPGGAADPEHSFVGAAGRSTAREVPKKAMLDNAVSADGSRVFWTSSPVESSFGQGRIFVRIDGERTVPVSELVSGEPSQFWTASDDGSKALISVGVTGSSQVGELYAVDVDTETPTLIAGEAIGVAGAADDLSRIYFVSREALAPGAVAGEPNLYVREGGTTEFIATIGENKGSVGGEGRTTNRMPVFHTARANSDGRRLVFMSKRSLTGYDSTEESTGELVDQVFLYDAEDELNCLSCKPSGARPTAGEQGDTVGLGSLLETFGDRVAAWLPNWENGLNELRPMSADGKRVFFNSFDALVPEDTNGVQDLYQWEEPGAGSCDAGDPEFSELNGGCVNLISTGQSPKPSEFTDASADGSSVFFETESSIDPEDPGLNDHYVARVGGGYPKPASPIPCVGDACQNVPPAPDDPTPASAGFRGAGDPMPRRNCGAVARRAAKLSRRAKRARRAAKRSAAKRRSRALRKRSARLAKRAKRISRGAKRCRRANRRAQR